MRFWLLVAAALLAACDAEPPPTVVIYAPTESAGTLRAVLDHSGFAFEIIEGDSAEITDSIIAKQDVPRADILVTSSAIDIWKAGDQGALRPLDSGVVASIPETLRDPDGTWAAISSVPLVIRSMPGLPDVEIKAYTDLGSPVLSGELCLTTSSLSQNRVLLAMLIEDLGEKMAERVVRLWARNLAQPPFASADELAAALQAGTCKVAVLSGYSDVAGSTSTLPAPAYRDIEGIGVTRHAAQPDAASEVVAWLLEALHLDSPHNSNGHNIGIAGWRDEEARLLAERAGYR